MTAPIVTVRGEAQLEGPPDLAGLSCTLHASGDSTEATRAQLATGSQAVAALLEQFAGALERSSTSGAARLADLQPPQPDQDHWVHRDLHHHAGGVGLRGTLGADPGPVGAAQQPGRRAMVVPEAGPPPPPRGVALGAVGAAGRGREHGWETGAPNKKQPRLSPPPPDTPSLWVRGGAPLRGGWGGGTLFLRDRRPGVPGRLRAGCRHGRGVPVRGPQRGAPAQGRRGYQIGERGHPVRAYLSVDEIIGAARRPGPTRSTPATASCRENPDLAEACAAAGITFVGPPAEVLELTGNKAGDRRGPGGRPAGAASSTPPSTDVDALVAAAEAIGFPLFVKAVAGGGGRGHAPGRAAEALRDAVEAAMREAECAFGDPTVFLEQAVIDPRHIEVQILADGAGNVMHLFERDCSIQRRHQKVVEIAPAPQPGPELRRASAPTRSRSRRRSATSTPAPWSSCSTSGRPARVHRDEPADPGRAHGHRGGHRRRPRAVPAADRRRGDPGRPRPAPGHRDAARRRALQCRITTEDPANGFRPRHRHGSPPTARPAAPASGSTAAPPHRGRGQRALRLDAGEADLPGPHLRQRRGAGRAGPSRSSASAAWPPTSRSCRPCSTTRTSAPAGSPPRSSTSAPAADGRSSADRGTQLLTYLADVTVNKPHGERPASSSPSTSCRPVDLREARPDGSRQLLRELGPSGSPPTCARRRRRGHRHHLPRRPPVAARHPGAHQDLLAVAPHVARAGPQLLSVECWGGATYDVALRFLAEDPWDRLARCARRCRTSACRCCCAAATPWATRRTRTR